MYICQQNYTVAFKLQVDEDAEIGKLVENLEYTKSNYSTLLKYVCIIIPTLSQGKRIINLL